jgi:hypothetical protein
MKYTISVAWVLETESDDMEGATESALHRDIISHVRANAALLKAKHADRKFKCVVADMIITSPEVEL